MSGIVIPKDRTTAEPVLGYCYNKQCRPQGKDRFEFIADNDMFACPKCGNDQPPLVGQLVLIHLLVQDRLGPIEGSPGLRYRIACNSKRAYLATATNLEAATVEREAANCATCLKNAPLMEN
jgi:hypothetical protein